ncbi:transcriptional regulatory protein [Rhodovulum sp. PH10]|uniref:LysR family transcriptional regulator n=1 Tax=Rhodovulum sp. PH10 TaxID=1187851 RepID=UPI00027C29AF|nr:LysR family transcriptional regulator [Rhodovulum sp. PH10]EJW13299.1 transcriptional regulatory protein [Rhodovulum sp. PH10]
MTNIPTELLRTLLTVVDLRSFTKAAQKLGVTQPAVSAQIKRLQFLLGFDLLDKSAPGVSLTEKGGTVVNQARRLLAINDQIVALARTARGGRTMRFGLPGDFVGLPLWQSLATFRARWPDVRLHMKTGCSSMLLHELEQGDLDVVVGMTAPHPHDMACHNWREELVWVRGPMAPLDPKQPLPIVSRGESCLFHRHMVAALEGAGRPFDIVFTAGHLDELSRAVAAGLGMTALTRTLAGASLIYDDTGLPRLADVACSICAGPEADPALRDELIALLAETLAPSVPLALPVKPAEGRAAARAGMQSVA